MINRALKEVKKRISMKVIISLITIMFIFSFALVLISQSVQAGDPPKVYFRFDIPLGCHYSPGWFGVMDKVPKNVTVLYYNDKAGYGLAYTTDTFFPKEAVLIDSKTADDVLATVKDEKGIYYGQKIADRWLPELRVDEFKVAVDEKGVTTIITDEKSADSYREITTKKAAVCPICGEFIVWYFDGLFTNRTVLACSKGHRIVTASYDTLDMIK
jgi:hypothetical protein